MQHRSKGAQFWRNCSRGGKYSDESESEIEATTTIENERTSEPAAASIEDLRLIIANQQSIILDLRATVIVKNWKIRHLKDRFEANDPPTADATEEANKFEFNYGDLKDIRTPFT